MAEPVADTTTPIFSGLPVAAGPLEPVVVGLAAEADDVVGAELEDLALLLQAVTMTAAAPATAKLRSRARRSDVLEFRRFI